MHLGMHPVYVVHGCCSGSRSNKLTSGVCKDRSLLTISAILENAE